MRKSTGLLALAIAAMFVFESPVVQACGDKLLSIARGMRLRQTYQARNPASILLYVGDLEGAKTSKKEHKRLVQLSILYMSLRQAGHKLEAVQTADELSQALSNGQFDFLMADLKDVGVMSVPLAMGGSKAEVLPVLFKPKKKDFASAREQFKLVLKTPIRSADHLEAIDEAMESRSLATALTGP